MKEKNVTASFIGSRGRSLTLLAISLAMGAGGVFSTRHYIEEQIAESAPPASEPELMVEVVVPTQILKKGDLVHRDVLAVREIPEKYADVHSIRPDNFESAVGQRIEFDIEAGSPLLWAHLAGGRSPTFSALIHDGLRAMTVRVDDVNSVSGFLQPEDSIDLLLTYGNDEDQKIFPLVQNLNVIATGSQVDIDKAGGSGMRSFSTITVHVSSTDAQRITLAQRLGKLTAMLRHPEDDSALSSTVLSASQLLGKSSVSRPRIKQAMASAAQAPQATIEYIIGGM
ncbi:MAG: Flp pilus assembly protein CpaB [Granulosicoccus sp.]